MEVVENNFIAQELVTLDEVQIKLEHKVDLSENIKKVLGVNCQLLGQSTAVQENEVILTGNNVIRLLFINELEKYDSQEIVVPIEKKFVLKDLAASTAIFANCQIVDQHWQIEDNALQINSLLNIKVQGVQTRETQYVSDLTGDVEVRQVEHKILSFKTNIQDQFEIEENIDLENQCEGVLGTDTNVFVKDITASEGKVTVKGVIAVNVLGVKNNENNNLPYNSNHEIDFAKSINVSGVNSEDLVSGTIIVNGITMHVENNHQGAVLVLNITLQFNGLTYGYQTINTVVDAIAFDKELTFQTSPLTYQEVLPQLNTTLDIENNLNLQPNMPYIAHVLAVTGTQIKHPKVMPVDGKVMFEGVLAVNLLLENEEHLVSNYDAEIPFQTAVRLETLDSEHQVAVTVAPLLVNVKARRGIELLVDAQLGISVQATNHQELTVVTAVIEGDCKVDDGSAIRIYIIGEKENLWDLAKRTNLSCAALLQQNPNLANGCVPGERIVVYRHEDVAL